MEDQSIPIKIEIDTLVKMIRMAFSFENWDNMIKISDELYESAKEIYEQSNDKPTKMERPLIYYFGYSQLMKGLAFQKKKQYHEAKKSIAGYEDLSWLSDGSAASKRVVEDFKFFAKANNYALQILTGNTNHLQEYCTFLQDHPKEALPGLITILEAANMHNLNIDQALNILIDHDHTSLLPNENNAVEVSYYVSFLYLLSIYKFRTKSYKQAIKNTLQALTYSDKIEDDKCFKKCAALFETFRTHASLSQVETYSSILKSIVKGAIQDEEGVTFDCDCIRTSEFDLLTSNNSNSI